MAEGGSTKVEKWVPVHRPLRPSNLKLRTTTTMIEVSKNNERRVIAINELLQKELRRLRTAAGSEFAFPSERGRPYRHISKGFNRACKRAAITDFRFHDLRHTFASHLVMSGVNLRAVQELMGHKDIKMTMRYSHLSRQHLQEAVGLLGVSLSGEADRLMKSVERQDEPKMVPLDPDSRIV